MAAKRSDYWVPNPTGDKKRFGDDFGHAFLGICALVEPAVHPPVLRDYAKVLREFQQSGLLDDLRARKDQATESVGDRTDFYRQILRRLATHRQVIRFDSMTALQLVISSLPSEASKNVLEIKEVDKYAALYESLDWFAKLWLNDSELGKRALSAQLALREMPEIADAIEASINSSDLMKTIMIPGFRREKTTRAGRAAFRDILGAFALASLPKIRVSTLADHARMFAFVHVKFDGSHSEAIVDQEFLAYFDLGKKDRSVVSKAIRPFVIAFQKRPLN
jgi:hypothetical protein